MKDVWRKVHLLALATGGFFILSLVAMNHGSLSNHLVGNAWAGQEQTIELSVTGMTCAACGFAVKTVLKRLDGGP